MHLAKGARQKWDIIICLSTPQPTVSKLHGYDGYMGQKVKESLQFFNINPYFGNIYSYCVKPMCIK